MTCQRVTTALAQAFRAPASDASRIAGIDGLRALAVLGVMASHYGLEYALDNLNANLQIVLSSGWTGVDLFFPEDQDEAHERCGGRQQRERSRVLVDQAM